MWRITFYCDDFYITAYIPVKSEAGACDIARKQVCERFGLENGDITRVEHTWVKYRGQR